MRPTTSGEKLEGDYPGKRSLLLDNGKIGIDVGWRVVNGRGLPILLWWGNTRDNQSLELLVKDLRKHPDYANGFDIIDLRKGEGK